MEVVCVWEGVGKEVSCLHPCGEGGSPRAYMCVQEVWGRVQKSQLSCVRTSSNNLRGNISPFPFNVFLIILGGIER